MRKIKDGYKVKIRKDRIKVDDVDPNKWYEIRELKNDDKVKGLKHAYELMGTHYTITRKDIKEMKNKYEII